ncbi:hypothetical protein M9H77_20714 [Catharanthus roseus]|uniref:Uncharacterized protein n=1 Tax=Catharanthus roseus TaxID=4058 RepID=A0ACC0AKZ4_CATRO|nr:hypothetical protein M9H77_20714 [Catharanthus roseus]
MKVNTYLIINRYLKSRTSDRRPYVTLACERGGTLRKNTKPRVDDEEEVPIKKRGSYRIKKYGCPFKLKGEQMATSENWRLFVHDGRHNYKIAVYNYGHAHDARLTEKQLKQTEQFRKSHVPLRNILRFFREQNVSCAVRKSGLMPVNEDVFSKSYHKYYVDGTSAPGQQDLPLLVLFAPNLNSTLSFFE